MWRVYYDDGSTYDGAEGVEKAPARGVQVIAMTDPEVGWYAQSGSDYYVWRDDRWWGVDIFGLFDYLDMPGWKKVLMGRTLTNAAYVAIWQRVKVEMGPKTRFMPHERQPEGNP